MFETKLYNHLLSTHNEKYGTPKTGVFAPGRVNIIGEHTDYNGGFVFPFTIDKGVFLIGSLSETVNSVHSHAFNQEIDLNKTSKSTQWATYFVSAHNLLRKNYPQIGKFHVSIDSNLPMGAGLSSSSAITCGFIQLISSLFNLNLSKNEIITLASISENSTGVLGGIMDQTAILQCKKDQGLLLNCSDNSFEYIPIELEDHQWLIINSTVQHQLSNTDYNLRHQESKEALVVIQENFPSVSRLIDINEMHLDYLKKQHTVLEKRARHFLFEQSRVKEMIEALSEKDFVKMGEVLNQGHHSLANLYDVSCDEIEFLIEHLKLSSDVLGARMMGGGFGGSIIALIKKGTKHAILNEIYRPYYSNFNIELSGSIVTPQDGLKVYHHV